MIPELTNLIRDDVQALIALVIAFVVSTFATPRLREAALRWDFLDRPDGRLKTQREPVPYLGGLAVALGVLVALGLTYQFDHQILATLLGASIVAMFGLADDLGSLRPWTKIGGQLLAAFVLVKAGVAIQLVFIPPWLAAPLTIFWILAITNAVNLLDIMDGLASGVGALAAILLGGIAFAEGRMGTAFVGAALAGALLGFRRFNTHPAKIYLGDTGSMLTGFLLGALAIVNSYTREHSIGAVAPLLILGLPLFDTAFVMALRLWRRAPVMRGSPDHVALRLRSWRLSTPRTVQVCLAVSAALGGSGLFVMLAPAAWALAGLAVACVAMLAFAAWLATVGGQR